MLIELLEKPNENIKVLHNTNSFEYCELHETKIKILFPNSNSDFETSITNYEKTKEALLADTDLITFIGEINEEEVVIAFNPHYIKRLTVKEKRVEIVLIGNIEKDFSYCIDGEVEKIVNKLNEFYNKSKYVSNFSEE